MVAGADRSGGSTTTASQRCGSRRLRVRQRRQDHIALVHESQIGQRIVRVDHVDRSGRLRVAQFAVMTELGEERRRNDFDALTVMVVTVLRRVFNVGVGGVAESHRRLNGSRHQIDGNLRLGEHLGEVRRCATVVGQTGVGLLEAVFLDGVVVVEVVRRGLGRFADRSR